MVSRKTCHKKPSSRLPVLPALLRIQIKLSQGPEYGKVLFNHRRLGGPRGRKPTDLGLHTGKSEEILILLACFLISEKRVAVMAISFLGPNSEKKTKSCKIYSSIVSAVGGKWYGSIYLYSSYS